MSVTQFSPRTTDQTLLAANASRRSGEIFNGASTNLYLLCQAATSSSSSFGVLVPPNSRYELPFGYTGAVHGVWAPPAYSVAMSALFGCGAECQIVTASEIDHGSDVGHPGISSSGLVLESTIIDPDGGTYSYKLPPGGINGFEKDVGFGNGVSYPGFYTTKAVGRVRFYADGSPDGNGFALSQFRSLGGIADSYIFWDNTHAGPYIYKPDGAVSSALPTPSTNAWHTLEWAVNQSANPWTYKARLDEDASTEVSTTYSHAAGTGWQGFLFQNTDGTANLYLDNILLSYSLTDYPLGRGFFQEYGPTTTSGTHSNAGEFKDETGTTITNGDSSGGKLQSLPGSTATWVAQEGTGTSDYVDYPYATSAVAIAPRAVIAVLGLTSSDATGGNQRFKVYDGASESGFNDSAINPNATGSATIVYESFPYGAPPSATLWTAALFQNLQLRWGYSSNATSAHYPRLNNTFIEAEFPIASGYAYVTEN